MQTAKSVRLKPDPQTLKQLFLLPGTLNYHAPANTYPVTLRTHTPQYCQAVWISSVLRVAVEIALTLLSKQRTSMPHHKKIVSAAAHIACHEAKAIAAPGDMPPDNQTVTGLCMACKTTVPIQVETACAASTQTIQ